MPGQGQAGRQQKVAAENEPRPLEPECLSLFIPENQRTSRRVLNRGDRGIFTRECAPSSEKWQTFVD